MVNASHDISRFPGEKIFKNIIKSHKSFEVARMHDKKACM
jgi:hypothetical protein